MTEATESTVGESERAREQSTPRPSDGWTGGQYSLLRVGIAGAVAAAFVSRLAAASAPSRVLLAVGIALSVGLAIGWRDRAVTANLLLLVLLVGAAVDGAPLVLPRSDIVMTGLLLALHLCVPIAPFGAWDARARIDPRGGWQRPAWLASAAWLVVSVIHVERAVTRFEQTARTPAELDFAILSALTALLEIAFALAFFLPRFRPPAWIALTLWQVAWLAAFGARDGDAALLLLHLFAADPGWWPGRHSHPLETRERTELDAPADSARLFYDGDCGFCHRSVRFILAEEANTPEPLQLRFAPLGGPTFASALAASELSSDDSLPDSLVLADERGRLWTRSRAVLEIAARLGGIWRALALVGRLVPERLFDRAYDSIARVRKRLFDQPEDACPILPPDLRTRFDP